MNLMKVTFVFLFTIVISLAQEEETKAPCDDSQTVEGNSEGKKCVFPFEYSGVTYNTCTNKNNDDSFWCATTSDYATDQKWGKCIVDGCDTPNCPVRTDPNDMGSDAGSECAFPFVYDGLNYYQCILEGKLPQTRKPWCSTTANFDLDKKWGICQIDTVDAKLCVFPFEYRGATYSSCVRQDVTGRNNQEYWCGTASSVDDIVSTDDWGYCNFDGLKLGVCATVATPTDAPSPYVFRDQCDSKYSITTTGGTDRDENEPNCVCGFPFIYFDKTYDDCTYATTIPNKNWEEPWCSCISDENYEIQKKWGVCTGCTKENEDCATITAGTSTRATADAGSECVFPFKYKGYEIGGCTSIRWNVPWCATTYDFDRDRKWGNCGATTCKYSTKKTEATTPTTTEATTLSSECTTQFELIAKNKKIDGAVYKTSIVSIEDCKKACIDDELCAAITFNSITLSCYTSPEPITFISLDKTDAYTKVICTTSTATTPTTTTSTTIKVTTKASTTAAPTTTTKAPTTKKPETCYEIFRGKFSRGGTKQVSQTIDDCKNQCTMDSTCKSFDFNKNNNGCFTHGSYGNKYDATSIDNYEKKESCAGDDNPDELCFDKTPGKFQFGGTGLTATVTLSQCLKECLDDATCDAFDYNRGNRLCFKHTFLGDLRDDVELVDHYIKKASCNTGD